MKKCRECTQTATYGKIDVGVECCNDHKEEFMIKQNGLLKCVEKDCNKCVIFGYPNEYRMVCSQHKKDGMINLKSGCIEEGCDIEKYYGYVGSKKLYCNSHKKDGMVGRKNSKCKSDGCKRNPNFGYLNQGRVYCKKHSLIGMINNSLKKCKDNECTLKSNYKDGYCKDHTETLCMINKFCKQEGCINIASYGHGKVEWCINHKKDSKRVYGVCKSDNCYKEAIYGINKAIACKLHKESYMIRCRKGCKYISCDQQAFYGYKKADFCSSHKKDDMKNVGVRKKKCENCGLEYIIGGRTDKKFCADCKPNRHRKTKEERIKNMLTTYGYNIISHDKGFSNNCMLRYRPDFIFDCITYFIVLEVDELGHNSYNKDCEIARMNNITHGLGLPTRFIRYNPDNNDYSKETKENTLRTILDRELSKEYLDNLDPIYLFY